MADEPATLPRPDHPDAERLSAGMTRLDAHSEGGANPFDAVSTWITPKAVMLEAQRVRAARRDGEGTKKGDTERTKQAGTVAFCFGFTLACHLRDPEAPLGAGPVTLADGDRPIKDVGLAGLEANMSSTLSMASARVALAEEMQGATDVESWQRIVSQYIDAASLQWVSIQVAMRLNSATTVQHLAMLQAHPQGQRSLQECVGMFIDGFLYASHLPPVAFAARRDAG